MATLFEIDQEILSCIDEETGEIIDLERLNELQIERDTKIKRVAQWHRNLMDDAEAYKENADHFKKKADAAKNKAESLKQWLEYALGGAKFEADDKTVSISYRKSEVVDIPDESKIPKAYKRVEKVVKVDKIAIKNAIKSGLVVKGAALLEKQNIQIK